MNKFLFTLILSLTVIGAYGAKSEGTTTVPADDLIAARQAGMDLQFALLGSIKRAMEGNSDVKVFKDAAEGFGAWSKAIPGLFPAGTERGHNTRALPVIWSDRAEFEKAAAGLSSASQGLAKAAASGSQADFAAAYQATGQACGACHKTFRAR